MTIWKYELELTDIQFVSMPFGSRLLSVGNQDGKLCLWALVDPDKAKVDRQIEVIGTGNPIPKYAGECDFIGTAIISPFVWHVFLCR